jgi:hypothetical protein
MGQNSLEKAALRAVLEHSAKSANGADRAISNAAGTLDMGIDPVAVDCWNARHTQLSRPRVSVKWFPVSN